MSTVIIAVPPSSRLGRLTVAVSVAIFLTTIPTIASSQQPDLDLPMADGTVFDLATSGNILYVAGGFNTLSTYRPGGVVLDTSLGKPVPGCPRIDDLGSVYTSVSDGNGGWFIGGHFDSVGTVRRRNLAHILNDLTVSSWNPNPSGDVWSMTVSGGVAYVGGSFTTVGGQPHTRLAAIDATSGDPLPWNPSANDIVYALAASGNTLYAGGYFTSISAQTRNRIAALDATTGSVLAWDPNVGGPTSPHVSALAVGPGTVYAGGVFTTIGGQARNDLAALDSTTGLATTWDPHPNKDVRAIVVDGSLVYAGGDFTVIGGALRNSIAALDASGTATPWNAHCDAGLLSVSAIVVDGSTVYAGGDFGNLGLQTRNGAGAVDATSGLANAWSPMATGRVLTLSLSGDRVFAGGYFRSVRRFYRRDLAAVDLATGEPTAWNPNPDYVVYAVEPRGPSVYVGGGFSTIGGQSRNCLAELDAATGLATAWNASLDASYAGVMDLVTGPTTMYIAGQFTSVGGQPYKYMAPLDLATLHPLWNSYAENQVNTVVSDGTTVYAGGYFLGIAGLPQPYLGAMDATTGAITSWNPGSDRPVLKLKLSGKAIYAGGDFTFVGGQYRNHIAALDPVTGLATSWNPNADQTLRDIAVAGNRVYLAGAFTTIGGQAHRAIAAVDATTGLPAPWNPNLVLSSGAAVYTVLQRGTTVYFGGDFTSVGGRPLTHLAAVSDPGLVDVPPTPGPASVRILASVGPNPLDREGRVWFELPRAGFVTLEILDVAGRRAKLVTDAASFPAGRHEIRLDREGLSPGLYFARLEAAGESTTVRFAVLF